MMGEDSMQTDQGIDPDSIAAAITASMGRQTDYLPVETDGAARAAALIAEVL